MTHVDQGVVMVRKLFSGFAAVALLLGLATTASAQQSSGSIKGTVEGADSNTTVQVVDQSRGITKSTSVSGGEFRVDGLQPGSYEVRVIMGGLPVDTETVRVRLAQTSTVSMATTVAAIEEIVTTGTRVATLDTSIAESGLVISADELLELPVQRDLAAVALLAPGTTPGDYRFNGNAAGSSGNVAFSGASVAENTSFVNGLNLTNFRTGLGFSEVPFEFYETLQIKTGGYSAKYGRSTGGVMNARTKSGSNEWKFGANAYYEIDTDEAPPTYLGANSLDDQDETTFDLYASGPIIKDRLFFYALYSNDTYDSRFAGLRSRQDIDRSIDTDFYGLKLDGYITDNHHIEFTMFNDERTIEDATFQFDVDELERGTQDGTALYDEGGDNWIVTYNGDLTDTLQLSVSFGENEFSRGSASDTADQPYVVTYPGFSKINNTLILLNAAGVDTREMTRVDLKWLVGDHDLSFGIDFEDNTASEDSFYSGGEYWMHDATNTYQGGCPITTCTDNAQARLRTYSVAGSFNTTSEAFYLQDVWTINDRWTVEAGIRNESFENLNDSGGVFVSVEDQWAPRLAAVWDPTGDGTSKVFANYGLYYIPIASNTNIRMAGSERFIQTFYPWDGVSVDGNQVPTGLGPVWKTDVFADGTTPDTRSVTDENIEPMYQSEFILGYTKTLDSGVEVGVKGIYRNLETAIEDVAIDAAVIDYYNSGAGTWNESLVGGDTVEDVFGGFHQYVLTNPGNDMRVYIPEMDEYISLTADQLNYPEAKRQYGAIELTFARPFDGKWGLQGSYTWSHNWGNHEGYVKSDNGQDDAGITTNFDQPGLVDNSYGDLPNDRRHAVKLWGNYAMDNGIRFGSGLTWQSGRPKSCFGTHPTDVFAQAYGNAAAHFCDGEPVQRGSLGTTPDTLQVNVNVQKAFDLGEADLLLSLDVFNLFDSTNAIQFNEDGDTPDFGLIRRFQEPRALRLSARVSF